MRVFLLLILSLVALSVEARQMVLVQGYLSNADSWRHAGITRQLDEHGWKFQGRFHWGSDGIRLMQPRSAAARGMTEGNAYYQVELPTEAPISHQAYYLGAYLKYLRQIYPGEPISIVGHSAGGVVARYVMVRNPALGVDQLVTIASPHLGTDTAEFGKMIGDSPLAMLAPMIGAGTLNRSQGLYSDLLPEMPHRFLYWLNRQSHPDAEYISIVREQSNPEGGDFVVPEQSQYLENVYDLRNRARSYIVPGTHALDPRDGKVLLELVQETRVPGLVSQVIRPSQ